MPRPRKWRRICRLPENNRFGLLDAPSEETITMTVDEFEAIRLIDVDRFTQEECADQMNVSRTTVQGIYDSARRKLAQSLVNGKTLHITGGKYHLCDGQRRNCGGSGCNRHHHNKNFKNETHETESTNEANHSHE